MQISMSYPDLLTQSFYYVLPLLNQRAVFASGKWELVAFFFISLYDFLSSVHFFVVAAAHVVFDYEGGKNSVFFFLRTGGVSGRRGGKLKEICFHLPKKRLYLSF